MLLCDFGFFSVFLWFSCLHFLIFNFCHTGFSALWLLHTFLVFFNLPLTDHCRITSICGPVWKAQLRISFLSRRYCAIAPSWVQVVERAQDLCQEPGVFVGVYFDGLSRAISEFLPELCPSGSEHSARWILLQELLWEKL